MSGEPQAAAPTTGRRAPVRTWAVPAAVGAVVVIVLGIYLAAYRLHRFQPVGWDIFGYLWQTNAIGHAALSQVGTRPGVPVMASLLGSVTPLPAIRDLVALPPALAVTLGLAAAVAVRRAFRLSGWWIPVVTATVALWPGTARILIGYEANLVLLLLVAAAVTIVIHAEGRLQALGVGTGLLAAAAFTHVVIFAAFAGVVGLYALASVPGLLRDRRAGLPLLATDAGAAALTVLGAGAFGAAALFGLLGLRPSQSVNTSAVGFLFQGRTVDEIRRIRPIASVPIGLLGALVACRSRGSRAGRALSRLGLAWLAVAGAGVLLSLRGHRVPGARFLLFALPVPVLAGLGIGAAAWAVARRPRPAWRPVLATALAVLLVAALARTGVLFIRYQFSPLKGTITRQLHGASQYLSRLPGERPVVVVVDQPGLHGAYSPKLRFNVIRATVPADAAARTFVYVGAPQNLLAGRPTLLRGTLPWQRAYDDISRAMWAQARPALREGAVVLIAKSYDEAGFIWAIGRDPARQVSPGLYVLRGPVVPAGPVAPVTPPSTALMALCTVLLLAALAAAGWGFAGMALAGTGATALDRACLSPAVGAGACVLGGFALAATGADPSGAIGIVALVVIAATGLAADRLVAGRSARRVPPPVRTTVDVAEPTGSR